MKPNKTPKNLFLLILLFSATFSSIAQNIFYVSNSGSDSNLGTSSNPFASVSHAIDAAVENDTIHILGTITENNISVSKSLYIIGDSPKNSVIQAQALNPHNENPRNASQNNRVFRLTSATSSVTFNNLTIQHGNIASGQGAAIYSSVTAALIMNNCNVLNNYTTNQGAAMSVKGTLEINNCSFVNNIANAAAGAVYHNSNAHDSSITNCLFYGNNSVTNNGAALWLKSKVATLNHNTIAFNTCDSENKTEGLYYGNAGKLIITNNILFNNLEANDDKSGGLDIAGTTPAEVISKNNIISYTSNAHYHNNTEGITTASGNLVNSEKVDITNIAFGSILQNSDGLYYLPTYTFSISKDAADSETAASEDINGSNRTIPDIGSFEAGTGENLPPVFVSSSSISYPEDFTGFQIEAKDEQSLIFSITGGADQNNLSISSSGLLTFNSEPVFDSPVDENTDNTYEVEISVSDGIGGVSIQTFELKVSERIYNVLMIVLDDLNDYIGVMGGHPQAITPNIDKLAGEGVLFTNASSNAPLCAPSRASFLTGILPSSSGLFGGGNFKSFPKLKNAKMISEYMMENGYTTYKTGKITHSATGEELWWDHILEDSQDYGPLAYNGKNGVPHPSSSIAMANNGGSLDGSYGSLADVPNVPSSFSTPGYNGWYSTTKNTPFNYIDADNRDNMPDEDSVEWIAQQLELLSNANSKDPFFMAAGLIRPHSPFIVPQKYFDLFPLEEIILPEILKDDIKDLNGNLGVRGFEIGKAVDESFTDRQKGIRLYLQAYLASIAFADEMVGELMSALESSNYADNTLVMLFSDHGYSIGEKDYMWKYNLWKQTSRVPLIIKSPKHKSQAGSIVNTPVSLIDIFPTIKDFCKLTGDTKKNELAADIDGHSLIPLLDNTENSTWTGPEESLLAVEAWGYTDPSKQNYALATDRYRYIIRSGGEEEFYDHQYDEHEWFNVANKSAYDDIMLAFRSNLHTRLYPSVIIEDFMENFSKMKSYSNFKLTSDTDGNMGLFDQKQIQKTNSELAEIIYEIDDVHNFAIEFWNTNDGNGAIDVGELKAYVAGADEVYSEIDMSFTSSSQNWNTANTLLYHTPISDIPEGNKYLKIEWLTTSESVLNKGYIGTVRIFNSDPISVVTGINEMQPVGDVSNFFEYESDQVRKAAPELPDFTDPLDNLNLTYQTSGCIYITGAADDADNTNYMDDNGRAVRCTVGDQSLGSAALTYKVEELNHFRVEFHGKPNLSNAQQELEVGTLKTYIAGENEIFEEISNDLIELKINGTVEQFAIVPNSEIPEETKYFKFEIVGGTNAWLGQIGAVHLYTNSNSLSTNNIKTKSGIRISPVPAQSTIRVYGIDSLTTYKIYSMQGVLLKSGSTSGEIDIESLNSGLYMILIDTNSTPIQFVKT